MDELIRDYADALFQKASHESYEAQKQEIAASTVDLRRRGLVGSGPLGGIAYGEMLRVRVAHSERVLLSRLNSYKDAYEHSGILPSREDIADIEETVRQLYETE